MRIEQNWKIVDYFLKNMSLHRIGACGDTKCQNLNSFFKRGEYIENEKLLLNLSNIKVFSVLE